MNYQLNDHLEQLIRRGEKLQAIKEFKDATGLSLIEAKNFVDEAEQIMRGESPHRKPDQSPNDDVMQLIRRGEKLMAVKVYKEQTGCDLIAAKDYIDELYEQLGPKPQETPTSNFREWSEQAKAVESDELRVENTLSDDRRRLHCEGEQEELRVKSELGDNHYDKGEPQGCLGMLLLLLLPVALLAFIH